MSSKLKFKKDSWNKFFSVTTTLNLALVEAVVAHVKKGYSSKAHLDNLIKAAVASCEIATDNFNVTAT
ncbi:MAG TPA: hypothetical protein VGB56_01500 [Flavisolibacter sp.]